MQSAFCQHHGPFIGSTSCNVYVCHHVMVNLVCMCVWRERERERERQWTYPLWSRFHRSKYPMARYLSFMCLHIFYIIPKFSFRFGRVLNLLTLNIRHRSNKCDMIERTKIILLKQLNSKTNFVESGNSIWMSISLAVASQLQLLDVQT